MSDEDEPKGEGEMTKMYKSARAATKQGHLKRNNVLDLIDTIIRRKRILPGYASICRNFCL